MIKIHENEISVDKWEKWEEWHKDFNFKALKRSIESYFVIFQGIGNENENNNEWKTNVQKVAGL